MKNKIKKIVIVCIVMSMLMTAVPMTAYAASPELLQKYEIGSNDKGTYYAWDYDCGDFHDMKLSFLPKGKDVGDALAHEIVYYGPQFIDDDSDWGMEYWDAKWIGSENGEDKFYLFFDYDYKGEEKDYCLGTVFKFKNGEFDDADFLYTLPEGSEFIKLYGNNAYYAYELDLFAVDYTKDMYKDDENDSDAVDFDYTSLATNLDSPAWMTKDDYIFSIKRTSDGNNPYLITAFDCSKNKFTKEIKVIGYVTARKDGLYYFTLTKSGYKAWKSKLDGSGAKMLAKVKAKKGYEPRHLFIKKKVVYYSLYNSTSDKLIAFQYDQKTKKTSKISAGKLEELLP